MIPTRRVCGNTENTFSDWQRYKVNFIRILVEKKRRPFRLILELCSHFLILTIILFAFLKAKVQKYPLARYDKLKLSIPLPMMKPDANVHDVIDSYNQIMSGPLPIPNFDEYIGIGKVLKPYLSKYHQILQHSANGKSLRLLTDPGAIYVVSSDGTAGEYIKYMNTTYTSFRHMSVIYSKTEKEAIADIQRSELKSVRPFVLITFYYHENLLRFDIRQIHGALPTTNMIVDDGLIGFHADYQLYFISGFLTFHKSLEDFLSHRNTLRPISSNDMSTCLQSNNSFQNSRIFFTPFPVFPTESSNFYDQLGFILGLAFVLAYTYFPTIFTKTLIEEEETSMRKLLYMSGLSHSVYLSSWITAEVFVIIWISLTSTIFTKLSMWSRSNAFLIFFFFYLYGVSLLSLGYLVSKVIKRAKLATVLFPVLLFLFTLPSFSFGVFQLSDLVLERTFASLLSPVAFSFGVSLFSKSESAHLGVQMDNLNGLGYNYALCALMLFIDILVYCLLAILLENYHTFVKWTRTIFIQLSRSQESINILEMCEFDSNSTETYEEGSENKRISIEDLSLVYPDGVVALDKVNLNMSEDHIFCLLGHNGSGRNIYSV
jgi:hypothetical protein